MVEEKQDILLMDFKRPDLLDRLSNLARDVKEMIRKDDERKYSKINEFPYFKRQV